MLLDLYWPTNLHLRYANNLFLSLSKGIVLMSQVEKRSSKVRTHNLLMAMRVIFMNKWLRVPGVKMIKSPSKYLNHLRCPTLQSLVFHQKISILLLWEESLIVTSKNSQCNNPLQSHKLAETLTSQSKASATTKTNAKS